MPRPFSAYAVLELEPGADRAAVEAAYRRLIKLHHPDRSGGDGQRAAEINRAYFELRSLPAPPWVEAPQAHPRRARSKPRRSRKHRWLLALLVLVPLALVRGDWREQAPRWASDAALAGAPPAARPHGAKSSALDVPIHGSMVADAVYEAIRLVERGDESALVEASRACHRRMRAKPGTAQFDRCAAFDTAVVALEDRDPNRDSGPFNASSVTARQMTAASLLSNDYLAIERRLNRIRSEVEMALAPPRAPAPPILAEFPEEAAAGAEP